MHQLDWQPIITAVAALIVAATPVAVGILAARLDAIRRAGQAQHKELAGQLDRVAAAQAGIRGAVEAQRGPGLPAGVQEDRRAGT